MAWRRARSLDVLAREIRERHPGTTVWDIGDAAHRASSSDHNPNAQNVVCAIDVLPDGGLDLQWFADRVTATDPPALKYVIYNRRIWHPGYGWSTYRGSNPHTGHVHVSVGVGPDGRSTGPYDDTSPWGLTTSSGGMDMFCKRDDKGLAVEALQRLLLELGFDPGPIDADYGKKTEAALSAARKAAGNKVVDGSEYTPAAWLTLFKMLSQQGGKQGERGPKGDKGDKGDRGPAGEFMLPARLTVTAVERVP